MAFEDTPDTPTAVTKSSTSKTSKNIDMAQPIVTMIYELNSTIKFFLLIKLNGKNYSTSSKMMLLHVSRQGKRSYLTGKVAQVEEDAPSFDSWSIEDSIVKGWAHAKKKNGGSSVAIVAAASQPFIGPVAGSTSAISISFTAAPLVDDSLTVLS
ncbi:unnamed protein product [Prunus brigantina]